MNDKVKTGGQAFPFSDILQGMTLRDYFAAKAMQGLLASGWKLDEGVAELSYMFADAMLKERDVKTT